MALSRTNILLIGCGCAGKIHERIWQKRGHNVFCVDLNQNKIKGKKNKYCSLEDFFISVPRGQRSDFIYDICCDTENHLGVLKTICELEKRAAIIVEKPVVSSSHELKELVRLMKKNKEVRLFVSENYFFSKTLEIVKQRIKKYKIKPSGAYMELSKNRETNLAGRRFVDKNLGVFGLEFPHMLAALSYLGFDKNLKVLNIKRDFGRSAEVDFKTASGRIRLRSSLVGRFFYEKNVEKNLFAKNRFRVLDVQSRGFQILVLWEPLKGKRRLYNRVIIKSNRRLVEDFYVYDNTIQNSLLAAEKYFKLDRNHFKGELLKKCYWVVKILNQLAENIIE